LEIDLKESKILPKKISPKLVKEHPPLRETGPHVTEKILKFLKGVKLEKHIDKFQTWEQLMETTTEQLQKWEIKPRERRAFFRAKEAITTNDKVQTALATSIFDPNRLNITSDTSTDISLASSPIITSTIPSDTTPTPPSEPTTTFSTEPIVETTVTAQVTTTETSTIPLTSTEEPLPSPVTTTTTTTITTKTTTHVSSTKSEDVPSKISQQQQQQAEPELEPPKKVAKKSGVFGRILNFLKK